MKKIIALSLLTFLTIPLSGCVLQKTNSSFNYGNYVGSSYKDNYVWGGAMNLAWNDLNENILHEKLKLNSTKKEALEIMDKFNDSPFTKNDLDDSSYYIKSGYGQKTIDLINKESKEKFPSKSFGDLSLNLSPKDIIAYAYFLKEVEYLVEFSKKDVDFKNEKVKGFYADNSGERDNIEILKYWDNNKFIISLKLKDNKDKLILAKGFDMDNPENIVIEINKYKETSNLVAGDKFEMPELHMDHNREYSALIGEELANSKFTDYFISAMQEKIKFDMDNKGARVENEAFVGLSWGASPPDDPNPNPKLLILDKPFWVIMKRADSNNPYFILGVKNNGVMNKI